LSKYFTSSALIQWLSMRETFHHRSDLFIELNETKSINGGQNIYQTGAIFTKPSQANLLFGLVHCTKKT
jgi:hypothetical protein